MTKKIYFASDFHLGVDALLTSLEREKKIIDWLSEIKSDASELYLVGDVFDHWYEYKNVVPKGFYRLFAKLAELRDAGISIFFFTGNHDMWMFRYMSEELGIPIYREPIIKKLHGKTFFIGHGDGLGPGDYGYKMIKVIFNNSVCQWLFRWVHPDIGLALMKFFSVKSRQYTGDNDPFSSPDKEWLALFSESHLKVQHIDYFIFGHRHLPIDHTLSNGCTKYYNLGEWMYACSYGVLDGENFELKFYNSEICKIYGKN